MGFFNFESDEDRNFREYSKKYRDITGEYYHGDSIHDLKRRIENEIDGGLTSMREHKALINLLNDLQNG